MRLLIRQIKKLLDFWLVLNYDIIHNSGGGHSGCLPPVVLSEPVEQPAEPAHRREQQQDAKPRQCKPQHEKGILNISSNRIHKHPMYLL